MCGTHNYTGYISFFPKTLHCFRFCLVLFDLVQGLTLWTRLTLNPILVFQSFKF